MTKDNANPLLKEDLLLKITNYLPKKNLQKLGQVNKFFSSKVESNFYLKINQKNFKEYFKESPAAGSRISFLKIPQHKSLKLVELTVDQIEKLISALEVHNKESKSDLPFVINGIQDVSQQFTKELFLRFSSLLLKLPELTILSLTSKDIEDAKAQDLAKYLERNQSLISLDLYKNQIADEGIKAIAKVLATKQHLANLNFSNNQIGNEGVKALAEVLEKNQSLKRLSLQCNQITVEGAKALAKALEKNRILIGLYLYLNKIGNEGAQALADALIINKTLTNLDLGFNEIGNEGAKAIAKVLETSQSLNFLDLKCNQIAVEGSKAIAKALEKNKSLEMLDLGHNQIRDEGLRALSKSLKINQSLRSINFNKNSITDKGAEELAESLKANQSLNSLSLEGNLIANEGTKALAEALKQNKVLTTINVAKNQITNEAAQEFAKILKFNTTLTKLEIQGNQINDTNITNQITSALVRNQKIAEFLAKSLIPYSKKDLITVINFIVRENEGVLDNQDKMAFKEVLEKCLIQKPNKEILLKLFDDLSQELRLKEETKISLKNLVKATKLPEVEAQKDSRFAVENAARTDDIVISVLPQAATFANQTLAMNSQVCSPSNSPNANFRSTKKLFSKILEKCFGSSS